MWGISKFSWAWSDWYRDLVIIAFSGPSDSVTVDINSDTASDCAAIISSPGNPRQALLLRSRKIPLSQIPGRDIRQNWSKHSTSLRAHHNHGSSIFTRRIARRPWALGGWTESVWHLQQIPPAIQYYNIHSCCTGYWCSGTHEAGRSGRFGEFSLSLPSRFLTTILPRIAWLSW